MVSREDYMEHAPEHARTEGNYQAFQMLYLLVGATGSDYATAKREILDCAAKVAEHVGDDETMQMVIDAREIL